MVDPVTDMQETQGSGASAAAPTPASPASATVNQAETIRVPSGGTVTKKQFAGILGVSPGRISQMIKQGLPIEANGKVDVARGRMWYVDNIDGRAQPSGDLFQASASAREERDFQEARIRRMKADQLAEVLVDKAETERVIFGRARADRDAWLAWPVDAAATIAAELHIDEAALVPVLKRLVRDHLDELSERSHADLA
jgi:phage terminase Nu1 subunit (DNA packaging protein)